jgi:maltose O-acetyltransferase
MALKSLNQFRRLREVVVWMRAWWLSFAVGARVHPTVRASLSSRLKPGRRGSIEVGPETLIAFKTLIYTRDPRTGEDRPVRIGSRCFIGGGSMILPGVKIGDQCVVGAGAVVFENMPSHSIVGGNPARVLREDVEMGPYGRLEGADENNRRLWDAY